MVGDPESAAGAGGPEGGDELERGGPPAEHLRELLRERFGDVPPESPTEPQHEAVEEGLELPDEEPDAEAAEPLQDEEGE